jgi:hypothetical protein
MEQEGDECYLHIGNNNDIREYASVHRSSKPNDCTVSVSYCPADGYCVRLGVLVAPLLDE